MSIIPIFTRVGTGRTVARLMALAALWSAVASASTPFDGKPLPQPLPNVVQKEGLEYGVFQIFPDGRALFTGGKPVPLSPEMVRRYLLRLEPIPPADLRRLINPKTGLVDYRQPEFARGRQGSPQILNDRSPGPYYAYAPPLDAKQILYSDDCRYLGSDPQLRRLLDGHRIQITALGWAHACKPGEKDCGYLQREPDSVIAAWSVAAPLVAETKTKVYFYADGEDGSTRIDSRPYVPLPPEYDGMRLPPSQLRHLRCRNTTPDM
ncbi:hypothetical protein [Acidithiobacillus caldus]|jgi:hypothetical protein|uniref:Uncharacterized protein n=2 Tax=Acidithiobacillus caldus TaxID=33059 RepID=A0A1E7YT20_9PROT|nr:hypothetical protein [Acidithiobacillus caldus]AIA56430.1 hypothetical protein Acaty_c2586 [Acidithiobacillus caldus ATCC 51756]MBU2729488.1 hypothetical protein [Acidithiobacillus caldus]MBU2734490.1 hypothetical protein [Acidithiobacillus caldus ATCC 51756]MBU2745468.1 hypothetical protein [Acidithiobacillus caldus]MBU2779286.1 hypothetical protein [Acidithiobacillus caldus]